MKKFLPLLFTLMLICLAACGSDTTAADTTADTTAPAEPPAQLMLADLAQYAIVRPSEAGKATVTAASSLYQTMSPLADGLTLKEDFFREGVPSLAMGEYEILVGNTNRPETAAFLDTLRYADYGYALSGKKLVIAGHTEEMTALAVEAFSRDVVGTQTGDVFFSADRNTTVTGEYAVNAMTLGGIPIEGFRVVYPKANTLGEKALADTFADAVARTTGYVLDVLPDTEASDDFPHEIRIGGDAAALAENEGKIAFDGTDITFSAANVPALSHIVSHTIGFFADEKLDTLALDLAAETRSTFDSTPLSAMSFNVYCNNFTEVRIDRVLTMIRNYLPDTVGVQEATPGWMNTFKKELGDVYEFVGEGRDGGAKGEHSGIGFKKSVFRLIETDTLWLSDTPEKVSRVPESSLNRVFTYALLERISDGVKIMVVNTHFEHTSDAARERQAEVLAGYLREWAEYPLILTGDFNTKPGTEAYKIVCSGGVENASAIALKKTSPSGTVTFNNYGKSNSVIDFVFTNQNAIVISDYRVCEEKINGDYPSDHLPVLAEYIITK